MSLGRLFRGTTARSAVLFALAAIAPLGLYAAFNGYISLKGRQAGLDVQAVAIARSLSENIDREIGSGLDEAQTLADSPSLDPGRDDLPMFRQVASRARRRHPEWLGVVLLDTSGRWLFNTEHDRPGVAVDMPSLEKTVRTGRPVVGDVVRSDDGRWAIPLRAPVIRDGKVLYVVAVVTQPLAIQKLLANLRAPSSWIVGVVNDRERVVARSYDEEKVIGLAVNAPAHAARASRPNGGGGVYAGRTLSGGDTQSAFWMSPTTQWSVHVAIPRAVYEAPLRQMALTLLAGFIVCLTLAGTLVLFWVRDFEVRRSHAAAVEQATRIDALGRLTGGVAHDFNNLLTVIQGNAEILSRRLHGAAQAERPLEAIRSATDRAAKLTRQLLVFARGGPTGPVAVDLQDKIAELMGPMTQLAGAGVIIEASIEPDLPPVSVDPLQLEAALLNLAANSRDAMGGQGRMEIRGRSAGDWVVLIVRDEGPGFEPSVLARVFDPFFTTKPVGQGTGLGLSQVYGLMKGVGGRVEASNAAGGGGMVSLFFPPASGPPQPPEPGPTGVLVQAPDVVAGVLLVDDNEAVRGTTAAFLRECGLSVVEAPDAETALRILETTAIEAVVSDIIMPGELDGIALAQTIRVRWPAMPILLVSGYSERAADAQARGFSVLSKPYSLPDVERRLKSLVKAPPTTV